MRSWKPYPWHAVERLTRDAVRLLRDARAALRDHVRIEQLAEVASSVLGTRVELVLRDLHSVRQLAPAYPGGACCLLHAPDGLPAVLVELEAELAHRAVTHLLSRPVRWADRSRPAPPTVQAAVGAACLAVARRACPAVPLSLRAIDANAVQAFVAAVQGALLCAQVTLLLDGEPYGVRVHVLTSLRPCAEPDTFGPHDLTRMGVLPLSLPVVTACSLTDAATLDSLRVGDAWMPGQGWTVRQDEGTVCGPVALCCPGSDVGLPAVLHADGRIVLGEGTMRVDEDRERSEQPPAETIADAIADAPIVVRVEVGSVVMRAREWASLRPGDVVATGRRLGERVTLRVGGVEVARGELVDVEGELGVRVHEIAAPPQGEIP